MSDDGSWSDEAPTWDDNPIVQAYSRAAFASLQQVMAANNTSLNGKYILDFGCGTGLLTALLAQDARQVVGLDVTPEMIAVLNAKNIDNITAHCADLDSAGLPAGSFDLITCSSVCAFLKDYPNTLATLAGLLAPEGLLVQWDWELDLDAEEPMGLSREAIEAALAAAGLQDITVDVGFEVSMEGFTMAPLRGIGRQPQP